MAKSKIMIVDDEQDIREVIKLHLGEDTFQILEAGDGGEAIRILKSEDNLVSVGLILCDIRMPNVDGVECIDYLKQNAPGIPIVVITAFPDPQLAASLIKRGVKDYLVKPLEKEKLRQTVDTILAAGKDFDY